MLAGPNEWLKNGWGAPSIRRVINCCSFTPILSFPVHVHLNHPQTAGGGQGVHWGFSRLFFIGHSKTWITFPMGKVIVQQLGTMVATGLLPDPSHSILALPYLFRGALGPKAPLNKSLQVVR